MGVTAMVSPNRCSRACRVHARYLRSRQTRTSSPLNRSEHLCHRCRGWQLHIVRYGLRAESLLNRYRQCLVRRLLAMRPHHRCDQRRRTSADRSSDHYALARGSISATLGRIGVEVTNYKSSSITARTSSRASLPTRFSRDLSAALRQSQAYRRRSRGDKISMAGLDVRVVTSAGETNQGAAARRRQAESLCANYKPGENNAEDPQSVGVHVTFGNSARFIWGI